MTKWEYVYATAYHDEMRDINGHAVEQTAMYKGVKSLPVAEFLKTAGIEGWEALGICPASEGGGWWRILLKRPLR